MISAIRLRPLLKKVNANSLFVDCGANRGDISALFADRGANVVAFEPDPLAYRYLSDRFNGVTNVRCIQKGVDANSGKGKLFFHSDRSQREDQAFTVSSSIVEEKSNIDKKNAVEIELIDLDDYIRQLDRDVDVLKMDVEGAEIAILEKMIANETYRKVGLMLVETHEKRIPSHREKVKELQNIINQKKIDNIKLNWI